MKKILIINTTLNRGGAARVAKDVFENLNKDFDMYFAYGRGKKDNNPKAFYFGNKIEMFIHIFFVRFFGLEGFGSYFSTKKLINFIKREKFDLINLHNLHGYYLNFFTLLDFLKQNKIPIAYSLHDEWPITWLPAHSMGCEHCKNGFGKCTNTYPYPKNYIPLFRKYMQKRKKYVFSDNFKMTLVYPSVWLKNSIENSFMKKYDAVIIPNSVDTEVFKPAYNKDNLRNKYNLPVDKKIITFSASNLNDTNKGMQYIIKTAELPENKDYYFVGFGNGNIKKMPNVKTLGYIYNKNQLAEIYALSDIYCFASNAETFFLSGAEAMACGIPIVGFDIPVVRELVRDDYGILTNKTSADLSKAINELLSNEKIQEIGLKGRKLIVDEYSKNIFYSNYKKIFEKE